jgi:hypothetical protein
MFLQGKGSRPTDTVSGWHGVPAMIKRLARNDAARTVIGLLLFGALVALGLLTIYYVGPNGFPTVHQHRIYKTQPSVDHHREAFRSDAPGTLRLQIPSTVEPSDVSIS